MNNVRPLAPADIPEIAALFWRVFQQSGSRGDDPPSAFLEHFQQVYFDHPFGETQADSFVYDEGGIAKGFLGVSGRTWIHGDRPIRVAVGSNLMVAPDAKNPFAAGMLVKSMLTGPFDLCFTDTGNDHARRLWSPQKGQLAPHASLHWVKLLRPATAGVAFAARSVRGGSLLKAAIPAARIVDSVVGREPTLPEGWEETVPGVQDAIESVKEEMRLSALRPSYTDEQLGWLLRRSAEKSQFGRLMMKSFLAGDGKPSGWAMYYGRKKGIGQVLALGGRPDRYKEILKGMFRSAHRDDCVAIIGKVDKGRLKEYTDLGCVLYHRSNYTLFRSDDAGVREAILSGNAHLSRLDGDWWTRFQGEEF